MMRKRIWPVTSIVVVAGAIWAEPAAAGPSTPKPPPGLVRCVNRTQAQLTVTPTIRADSATCPAPCVKLGDAATVTWKVTVPSGCAKMKLRMNGEAVPASGFRTVHPIADSFFSLTYSTAQSTAALVSRPLNVQLPPTVQILADNQAPLLVQALRTEETTIVVANHVQLDLSDYRDIPIAGGVTLQGGRARTNPGPRLFSRTRSDGDSLLRIVGDDVRITGLRIEGPDTGAVVVGLGAGIDTARGIFLDSVVGIEIDNNELSGWASAAIEVQDTSGVIPAGEPYEVKIHDNFIHHNQNVGGNGYGVATRYGGYALIEHNVFDFNRHAIAADARDSSGYVADGNLVLANGGFHTSLFGVDRYTHQFDAHGSDSCGGIDHNCGRAGESFYIRNNTFRYTRDDAIRLRGKPVVGMFVDDNVFAHDYVSDAVSQTVSGMQIGAGNVARGNLDSAVGVCDFDGDGINDTFMTTGITWWYSSGGATSWRYLNTSRARRADVTFGHVDSDARCDVTAGGTVFPGGKPGPLLNANPDRRPGGGLVLR